MQQRKISPKKEKRKKQGKKGLKEEKNPQLEIRFSCLLKKVRNKK